MLIFGGMRFARGPLTLGQRMALSQRAIVERVVPVPPGTDLAGVSVAVHALVCRHEALRTRFPAGDREQVVDGAGMLTIRTCGTVGEALGGEPFDLAAEWGIRVTVVCRGDRPESVVLCLSNLAVDAWAADLVVADLAALLRGADLLPPVWQPVEQAEAESTPDGLRERADALARLREVLLTAPVEPAGALSGAWHLGELRSSVVDPAARAVAVRCRTTPAVVYLAAAAVGLGAGPHVLSTSAPNRLTPAEKACVAPFAVDTFVPVDASREKFDAVVVHAGDAYREAGGRCRYDPTAVEPLVAQVAARRGRRPELSVLVSAFRTVPAVRSPVLTRHLTVAGDGAAVTLSLLANDAVVAREHVPEFLDGMVRLIVAAADGDLVL